jgi:hypothetical protein
VHERVEELQLWADRHHARQRMPAVSVDVGPFKFTWRHDANMCAVDGTCTVLLLMLTAALTGYRWHILHLIECRANLLSVDFVIGPAYQLTKEHADNRIHTCMHGVTHCVTANAKGVADRVVVRAVGQKSTQKLCNT